MMCHPRWSWPSSIRLPDDERFMDGNWALVILSVNLDGLADKIDAILNETGEYATAKTEFLEIFGLSEEKIQALTELYESIGPEVGDELINEALDILGIEDLNDISDKLNEWYRKYLSDLFYFGTGAAGQDGRTVRMVCRPGLTVPILVRFEFDSITQTPVTLGAAVYTLNSWHDLGWAIKLIGEKSNDVALDSGAGFDPEDTDLSGLGLPDLGGLFGDSQGEGDSGNNPLGDLSLLNLFGNPQGEGDSGNNPLDGFSLDGIKEFLDSISWLKKLLLYEIKGGQVCVIPSRGLDNVVTVDKESLGALLEAFEIHVPVVGEELLTNGDFSDPTPFQLTTENGGSAQISVVDGELRIDIDSVGGTGQTVQAYCDGFALSKGTTYTLSYDVRASVPRDLTVCVRLNGEDHSACYRELISVTDQTQHHSATFTVEAYADAPRLCVDLGYVETMDQADVDPASLGEHQVFFDNFSLIVEKAG